MMSRITEIEIAGKKYPLNFSTKAAKEITKRYGDIANVTEAFKEQPTDKMMDEIVWLLALLISQGVAYRKIADDEDIQGISAEDLEVVLGVGDYANLKDELLSAMTAGSKREVEVEPDPKNAETTQDK